MSNKNKEASADTVATDVVNYTITLKRGDHPQNRSSYIIPGNPGNVVFFNTLFANGTPPESITLSCAMVSPKADAAQAKAEAAAAKALERAAKMQAKIEAAAAKAAAKQAKAEAALAAAKAKVDAAAAATADAPAS